MVSDVVYIFVRDHLCLRKDTALFCTNAFCKTILIAYEYGTVVFHFFFSSKKGLSEGQKFWPSAKKLNAFFADFAQKASNTATRRPMWYMTVWCIKLIRINPHVLWNTQLWDDCDNTKLPCRVCLLLYHEDGQKSRSGLKVTKLVDTMQNKALSPPTYKRENKQ